jgi:ribosomal protein S18 acetylase RimI-like enzyme
MINNNEGTEAHDGEVIVVLRRPDGSALPATFIRYVSPQQPVGYLSDLPGVTVRRITSPDEVRAAIRIRQPWAGKILYALPPVVYHTAMEAGMLAAAFADEGMVGYLLLKRRKRDNALEIQQIAVMDTAPKGVGRRLTSYAWDVAVDGGYGNLMVTTLADNARARNLYERFGFSIDRQDDKDIRYRIGLSAEAQRPPDGPSPGLGGEIA